MKLIFEITETPEGHVEVCSRGTSGDFTKKEIIYFEVIRELVLGAIPIMGKKLGATACIRDESNGTN